MKDKERGLYDRRKGRGVVDVSLGRWGTRRKGGRPAEFTSEIANMNTNEIVEFRIETKRTTSILGAEVYEELLFCPFRPVVRTSSFHVEDTGSIPVRDRYLFPAGGIIAE